ncbi:universal stress protein [Qipengyuania gaetbuli]|uniref:Universal stress protein n=1 Tax=Qipengyuania gaetbuli TaxID=266952 RepID=A0A844XZL2_9SPHN|nr:universal stress protein [Qipengyuania gaetbuli]MBY6013670.1 universal stress protein [Qipengyuania gaetbuli]MCA0908799.1 universal stress protein [Qipengyuania gaetbuli]MXO50523.1 universal stress protein [Qipengyuania gaetbuli]
MRVYLVVMDETEEAQRALRFASLRAQQTGGSVHILALVPQQTFNAFGGVQATIEQEARERAEVMANNAAGNIFAEMGKMPVIAVRPGAPADVINKYLEEHGEVAALVLGTAKAGGKDPLVQHFSARASELPCPLYIVPGSLTREQIDALG